MDSDIKFTDWNKLMELNKKVACGNEDARGLLTDLVNELDEKGIITYSNSGYLVSRNGVLQDFFRLYKGQKTTKKFTGERVAHDFAAFLREKDKDSNYSVVSI